ncbi:amyloid-beta A4 precursor protein-binding family A member 1-like [Megalops cyprinoides]|uniref:amyloid-beta A4 precursor protein-binding family A member 1-like n=1 Tax=Megalops cyprinoides TaxID=118141 RepID=UPI001863BDF5|nr:amyloid-beta A4 precursor protein-binding family A member 1-like [Megalops cyprinoides]
MSSWEEVESGAGPGSNRAGSRKSAEVGLKQPGMEADQWQAPPPQRPRQPNGRPGAGEGVRSGWRPCQQHSQTVEPSVDRQNHRHGNQQRYRRYEASGRGGGRWRGHRPVEEGGEQQVPRPGVARYRRTQQHKHKYRHQEEAEPTKPPPTAHTGQSESSFHRRRAEGRAEVLAGGEEEAVEEGDVESQSAEQNGGMAPPLHSLLLSRDALNTPCSHRAHSPQKCNGEPHSQQQTEPQEEPSSQPCREPGPESSSQPCREPRPEPSSQPCREPRPEPSSQPCREPRPESSSQPCREPRPEPSSQPCRKPGPEPSSQPCREPRPEPSSQPCREPGPESPSRPEPSSQPCREPGPESPSRPEPSSQPCREPGSEPSSEWMAAAGSEARAGPFGPPQSDEEETGLALLEEWKWTGQTALQVRRAGLRLFGRGGVRLRQAVGLRLHHYDERSDSESESPETEVNFSPFPLSGGRGLEERCRSQSWHRAIGQEEEQPDLDQVSQDQGSGKPQDEQAEVGQRPGKTQDEQAEVGQRPDKPQDEQAEVGQRPGKTQDEQAEVGQRPDKPQDEHAEVGQGPGEPQNIPAHSEERGDAISLVIRDIKEAIEEVKTRAVRSPYTPEEPKEPIWVMRQDPSPTEAESDLQPAAGDDSPDCGSPSPLGAECINSQHALDMSDSFEAPPSQESRKTLASFPTYVDVPGPCDPEDLIDGIIFAANYLGSTQLLSEKTPPKSIRMTQAQEAVSRVQTAQKQAKGRRKAPEGDAQVDLFISTQRIKVLNADSQETMMDHALRTISYIADIGDIVVLMARRRKPRPRPQEPVETSDPAPEQKQQYRMICHVFESEDAQLIAQSIGQAFSVAYQEFLRANGINPEDLSQKEYSDLLSTQDMYNDDLIHFSKSENCKDVCIEKQKGEILGVVVVESGWGSILPTVIIASMMHAGPAEKSGRLSIGDQIMSINGTSLVGLPLPTCQSIIKALKSQSRVKLNIVRCPPVTMVLIRRPDLRYQLGFSVQNGIICSLMRGGIAERGGVRVGHRIIEINGQSVVATPHDKIVSILSTAVGEIHMKTMPAAMYRLLTGQEQPIYI